MLLTNNNIYIFRFVSFKLKKKEFFIYDKFKKFKNTIGQNFS